MSNELKFEATFDGQKAKKDLKDFNKEVNTLDTSAQKVDKSLNDMFKTSNGTTNYKRQLKEITKQIQDLTINYRQLSAAEKASASGQEMSNKIKELTKQASIYQDAMMDVQQAIRAGASDTLYWDAAVQGMGVLTGAAQGVIGIMGTLGGDTQKMVKALAAIKSIESVFTTMKRLQAAMQGQSAVMQLIKKLSSELVVVRGSEAASAGALASAEAGSTAAKIAGGTASETLAAGENVANVATKRLTVSTLALKAAMGGIAVAALVAGISLLSKKMKEYNEEVKRTKEMNEKLSTAAGEAVGKFMSLKAQWDTLADDDSRQRWARENASALKDLGKAENDLMGIDKMFAEQSESYIEVLRARAEAAAAGKMIEQAYTDAYKQRASLESIEPGKIYPRKTLREAGFNNDEISFGNNVSTGIIKPGDFIKAVRRIEKEAQDAAAEYAQVIEDANKRIANASVKLGDISTDPKTPTIKTPKRDKLDLKDVNIKIKKPTLTVEDPKIDDSFKNNLQVKGPEIDFTDLDAYLEKIKNIEKTNGIFNNLGKGLSSVESIFGSLDELAGDAAGNFFKVGQAAVSGVQGILQAVMAYQELMLSAGAASAMELPFPANIIGAANVLAAGISMIAKIASAAKYASGGIINAPSKIGDMNIARVNDGEMILNNYQQAKLWDFINSNINSAVGGVNSFDGGKVEFVISNDSLRGVLENGYRRSSRT